MSVLISTGSELELLRLNIVRLKYRVTPGGVGGEDQLTLTELTGSGVSITSVGGEGGPVNSNSSSIFACIIVSAKFCTINSHIHSLAPRSPSTDRIYIYTFYVVYQLDNCGI